MITFASALRRDRHEGRGGAHRLASFGFRRVLIVNSGICALFLALARALRTSTPVAVIIALLLVGGFFRSLQFTSINAIAYAEVVPARMSRATTLASVGQQLSISTGVAVGALAVEAAVHLQEPCGDHGRRLPRRFPAGRRDLGDLRLHLRAAAARMPASEMAGRVAADRVSGTCRTPELTLLLHRRQENWPRIWS